MFRFCTSIVEFEQVNAGWGGRSSTKEEPD